MRNSPNVIGIKAPGANRGRGSVTLVGAAAAEPKQRQADEPSSTWPAAPPLNIHLI